MMFPDSSIATKFSCGETKCSYLLKYGLAPYFKQLLLDAVKHSSSYVVMFDDSLNKSTQQKQLDVHVRYWQAGQVRSQYLGSEFLGHSASEDVQQKLYSNTKGLNIHDMIQVSMDGPNVNLKV